MAAGSVVRVARRVPVEAAAGSGIARGLEPFGNGSGGIMGVLSQLPVEKADRERPCPARGLEVRAVALFLGAQESMAGAGEDVWIIALAQLLHYDPRRLDGRRDSRIVA